MCVHCDTNHAYLVLVAPWARNKTKRLVETEEEGCVAPFGCGTPSRNEFIDVVFAGCNNCLTSTHSFQLRPSRRARSSSILTRPLKARRTARDARMVPIVDKVSVKHSARRHHVARKSLENNMCVNVTRKQKRTRFPSHGAEVMGRGDVRVNTRGDVDVRAYTWHAHTVARESG